MPRTARTWEPGLVVHVASRAHEGAPIFASDDARRFVLRAAVRVLIETKTRCLAWAVLSNHYHMLIQCDTTSPGAVIHRINTRIARRVRRVRGERGAVFQSRYHSTVCRDESAYVEMLSYVLGNPLRHGVVRSVGELERHRWSGLGEVLGLVDQRVIDVSTVLGRFHADAAMARAAVRAALEARSYRWLTNPDEEPDVLPIPARVATDEGYRRELRAIVGVVDPLLGDWDTRRARRVLLVREGWHPAWLLESVSRRVGAVEADVRAGRKSAPEAMARAIVAFVACDYAGHSAQDVATLTGVGSGALCAARRRGRGLVERLGLAPAALLHESQRPVGTVLGNSLEVKTVPSDRSEDATKVARPAPGETAGTGFASSEMARTVPGVLREGDGLHLK